MRVGLHCKISITNTFKKHSKSNLTLPWNCLRWELVFSCRLERTSGRHPGRTSWRHVMMSARNRLQDVTWWWAPGTGSRTSRGVRPGQTEGRHVMRGARNWQQDVTWWFARFLSTRYASEQHTQVGRVWCEAAGVRRRHRGWTSKHRMRISCLHAEANQGEKEREAALETKV